MSILLNSSPSMASSSYSFSPPRMTTYDSGASSPLNRTASKKDAREDDEVGVNDVGLMFPGTNEVRDMIIKITFGAASGWVQTMQRAK